jgi:hypothetical protein
MYDLNGVTNASSMFKDCWALQKVPAFDTSTAQYLGDMFAGCNNLAHIPALNCAGASSNNGAFNPRSVTKVLAYNMTTGFSIANCPMSTTSLNTLWGNLGKASGAQTITIGGNAQPAPFTKASCGTTAGSKTVTCSDTSFLTGDKTVSGTGISTAMAVTFQDTGDTVTKVAHGIDNGTRLAFTSITSTTGISTYTIYYVVNATADTFQVSDTEGGSARTLTTDGSGNMIFEHYLVSVVTNVSFTMNAPAHATGTITATFTYDKRYGAWMKGWTV